MGHCRTAMLEMQHNGYITRATSDGYVTKATSDGYLTRATSDGYFTRATSDGYFTRATSDGYLTRATSDGYFTRATSDGYLTRVTSDDNIPALADNTPRPNATMWCCHKFLLFWHWNVFFKTINLICVGVFHVPTLACFWICICSHLQVYDHPQGSRKDYQNYSSLL